MKMTSLAIFGAGYVLGSRSGRKRYEQLAALARTVTSNFEDRGTPPRLADYSERLENYVRPFQDNVNSDALADFRDRGRPSAKDT